MGYVQAGLTVVQGPPQRQLFCHLLCHNWPKLDLACRVWVTAVQRQHFITLAGLWPRYIF